MSNPLALAFPAPAGPALPAPAWYTPAHAVALARGLATADELPGMTAAEVADRLHAATSGAASTPVYSLELAPAPAGDAAEVPEFRIPLDRWADFRAKFAKLARKAERLGVAAPGFQVIGDAIDSREYRVPGTMEYKTAKVPVRVVRVTGEAPRLNGWIFAARVERLADGSALLHRVPVYEGPIDSRFRHGDPSHCDHCRKARVRADTFIVARESNPAEQIQVGRQCLADFTGINTPEKAAAQASYWLALRNLDRDADGEDWAAGYFAESVAVADVLALASAYVRGEGWISKAAAAPTGRESTGQLVGYHFSRDPRTVAYGEKWLSKIAGGVQDSDRERAAAVARWLREEFKPRVGDEYGENLCQLARGELATRRHIGLLASALAAYQRAMNRAEELKAAAARPSVYVGKVGERLRDVPVTVEFVKALEGGMYGPRTLLKFRAVDSGAVLVWFASGDREPERGARYLITGTVKEHSEYQGVKQTKLSRVSYTRASRALDTRGNPC